MPTPVTPDYSIYSGGKAGQQCSSAAIIVASEMPKYASKSPKTTPEPPIANKEPENATSKNQQMRLIALETSSVTSLR